MSTFDDRCRRWPEPDPCGRCSRECFCCPCPPYPPCPPCPYPPYPPCPPPPPPPPPSIQTLRGIQVNLLNGTSIADDASVPFDSIVNNKTSSVSYTLGSGNLIFLKPGNYFVTWSVAVNPADSGVVSFSLTLGGVDVSASQLYVVDRGVITGSALITVTTTPVNLQLVNRTGATVPYDIALDYLANLVILEVC